jgi:hypothetical protein
VDSTKHGRSKTEVVSIDMIEKRINQFHFLFNSIMVMGRQERFGSKGE